MWSYMLNEHCSCYKLHNLYVTTFYSNLLIFLLKILFLTFREALNLAESPPHIPIVKRERDHPSDYPERERDVPGQPPQKRNMPIDKSHHHNKSNATLNDERSRTPMNEHDMSDDRSHVSSPCRNGINGNSTSDPSTILSGMQFKITSRGKLTKPIFCTIDTEIIFKITLSFA